MRRDLRIPSFLVLCLAFLASFAGAQAQDPRVGQARAAFGANRVADGITLLEQVLADHPEDPLATHLMGYGLHMAGRRKEALVWHEKGTHYPSVAGPSYYNIACVHALDGKLDAAFKALGQAREAGFRDQALAAADTDLNALHGDARFAAFLKSLAPQTAAPAAPARTAAAPFASNVRVLHAIEGEAPGDQFGWIARKIGDVDGDSVQDFTTSAPTKAQNGAGAGRVYVYSGKSAQQVWFQDGEAGAMLGMGLEAAGDVDGDGYGDVIAGAPGTSLAGGKVFIYSGRDGALLLEIMSSEDNDRFGRSVAGVGDLNGDGKSELLIGAPEAQGGGRAYLYSGKGQRLAIFEAEEVGHKFGSCVAGGQGLMMISAKDAGMNQGGRVYVYRWKDGGPHSVFDCESDQAAKEFGAMFLSVVGDVNGDGAPDLYASDWNAQTNGPSAGRIQVHSGVDGTLLADIKGAAPGECFGIGPGRLGDWDGDGCDDLVVGAWRSGASAPVGGRVGIYSGQTSALLWDIPCAVPNETLGFDAEGMGDLNGDGQIDLLITGAWSACRGDKSGRIWLLSR